MISGKKKEELFDSIRSLGTSNPEDESRVQVRFITRRREHEIKLRREES